MPYNNAARQQSDAWKCSTKRETESALADELVNLLQTGAGKDESYWRTEFEGFQHLFAKFLHAKPTINWENIQPLPTSSVRDYATLLLPHSSEIREQLNKLVVVKLNGGLGTSMGCKGPKSSIPVRNDLTFLDLIMQQIEHLNCKYDVDVPLVLMNSFNTDEDTQKIIKKYRSVRVSVHCFNQSRYPRINKETLMPIASKLDASDRDCWYPPGHGNFFSAFYNSGLLDTFVNEGKEWCFLSNVDNLGATVDLRILNLLLSRCENTPEFIMGGTLIQYEDRLMLLEIAQVPKDHQDEFKSISKFKIFNTNNLWFGLKQMKAIVETSRLEMEVIVNPKHLANGLDVLQLETAAGAAIKCFPNAVGLNVPRDRFLPVKKTQDLFLVMSNLYELEEGRLRLSTGRSFKTTPLIKLGSNFDYVNDFLRRMAGIPDILELDHLTVAGDVTFDKGVSLKGTVIIIANHGERIDIPAGSVLENKIVSGNLRILDH